MSTMIGIAPNAASDRGNGRYRREFVLACLLATVATMATPALLSLSGYLLARASQAPPILTLTTAIVGVRLFAIVRAAGRYGERLVSHDLALRLLTGTRVAVYERMIARPQASESTSLLDRLVADTERLQDRIVRVRVPAMAIAITAVAAVTITFVVESTAGIVLATAMVVHVAITWLIEVPSGRRRAREHASLRESLTGELVAVLDGAAELTAWGAGEARAARAAELGARVDRRVRHDAARASAGVAVSLVITGATTLAVLLIANAAVADGRLGPNAVPALALLAFGAIEAIGPLSDVLVARNEVAVARERIAAIVDAETTPTTDKAVHDVAVAPVGLSARGIGVRLGDRRVLADVDLDVAPGERVALVGPSGVGKSVLTRVMMGLQARDAGTAAIDGRPVERMDETERAEAVSWAPQDPYIFPTSIADNVRISNPDADDAAVEEALRAVGAGPWIDRLPEGIHTRVGEFGATCSGGERQRIGLARVALSSAPFAVLDEPASHLPRGEVHAAIRAAVDGHPGRGVLLVTHHDDELELMDRVVTLDIPEPK